MSIRNALQKLRSTETGKYKSFNCSFCLIYLFVCLVFCYSIYSFISLFIYFSQAVNAILLTQQGWTSLLLNCSVNQ